MNVQRLVETVESTDPIRIRGKVNQVVGLVIETIGDDSAPAGVTVVVNWLDELERRVPVQ